MSTHSVHRRVFISTGIVMSGILASRLLGFFREWAVAHQVGSNAMTDAYYAAFTLPDFLNYLVAGASLSATFIPVFAKYSAEGCEEEGWWVFSTVITFMGSLMAIFIVIGEIFAPQLAHLIAPGFAPAERRHLIFLTRLMLPAQFCFYEGSILSAVQYAKGHFLIPSLAPVVYNLMVVLGGLLLASRFGMTAFALGVLAGALLGNLLLQIYGAISVGAQFSPNLNLRHPGFTLFLRLSIPIMLALSLVFTDDWITRWFGSYLPPASITWLSYGKTLMLVPVGVVGQGLGVASFPFLAQLYSEGKIEALNRLINTTMKCLIALLVPASALAIAESSPVVYLVFSHTRLRGLDFDATAATLVFFSLGMFAWGAQNILARGFYATRNTMTPAIVGTVLAFASIPVYWILVQREKHLGLALASSLGMTGYTLVLFLILYRRTRNCEAGAVTLFFLKVCAASVVVAWACHRLRLFLGPHFVWHAMPGAFVLLVIVTSAGIVLFLLLARLLGIREFNDRIANIRRMLTCDRAGTLLQVEKLNPD